MEADIIGLNKILDCIKGSNFTKLAVYRYPQNSGNIPVFEKLNAKSNHELVKDFNDWGKNIDNSVIYEINLFDDVSVTFDDNGQEKLNFIFSLKKIIIIVIIIMDLVIQIWQLL